MEKQLSPTLKNQADKIESQIKSNRKPFTLNDVVSFSGVAIRDAKEVMDALMAKFDCRLKVTDNGDLIYDFGSFHRRGERTWGEWWRTFQKSLWNAFVIFFKAWISITLVVYFLVFVVILIALIIGAMSANNDSDSGIDMSGCSGGGSLIGDIFQSIFIWNTMTRSYHYETDARGYSYRVYDAPVSPFAKRQKNKKKKKGKDFVASVYDFVFGPPRVELDPLENQQEVAAFLRKNKGVIVKPELIGLAGWTDKEADDFFSDVLVRFNGDSSISENQILYGDFHELTRSKSDIGEAPIIWYWNEYEPEYKLTGNSIGRNIGVGFMNGFNLIFSLVFIDDPELLLQIGLGWVPLIFSLIFFTVPFFRWFTLMPKRRKRRRENIRKRVMRAIFQHRQNSISPNQLTETANAQKKEEKNLSQKEVERMMAELILDLKGDIDYDTNGKVIYKFDMLNAELAEAERLRSERDAGRTLGNVIFDSKN